MESFMGNSWLHFCELRDGNGTQRECQDVAKKCKIEVLKHFPFLETVWKEGEYND